MESAHEEYLSLRAPSEGPVSLSGEQSRRRDPGFLSETEDASEAKAPVMHGNVVAITYHARRRPRYPYSQKRPARTARGEFTDASRATERRNGSLPLEYVGYIQLFIVDPYDDMKADICEWYDNSISLSSNP